MLLLCYSNSLQLTWFYLVLGFNQTVGSLVLIMTNLVMDLYSSRKMWRKIHLVWTSSWLKLKRPNVQLTTRGKQCAFLTRKKFFFLFSRTPGLSKAKKPKYWREKNCWIDSNCVTYSVFCINCTNNFDINVSVGGMWCLLQHIFLVFFTCYA